MISVKKDFDNPPSGLKTDNCTKKRKKSLEEKNNHKFKCYNDYPENTVFEALKTIYNSKCGYCETEMNAGYKLQIEHYRPKKEVKEDKTHKGYYWLGYEWSNLLLACPKCNQQGAKGNYFPITGVRIHTHSNFLTDNKLDSNKCYPDKSPLKDEKPLFLNPEIDEVEKHLIFSSNGEAKGITERGKITIEICNLNSYEKRADLIIARKTIIVLNDIREDLDNYLIEKSISEETLDYNLKKIFIKILEGQNKDNGYSRVYFFLYNKFEIFILRKLGKKQRNLIEKKFELFKNGEL